MELVGNSVPRVVHKSTGRLLIWWGNLVMSVGIESLFTSALGLQAPWSVKKVELDTSRRRIDFQLSCDAKRLPCPQCNTPEQGVHDRLDREWRHLDFFQFEAWLHAGVRRVSR